jgi:hypothetical protein
VYPFSNKTGKPVTHTRVRSLRAPECQRILKTTYLRPLASVCNKILTLLCLDVRQGAKAVLHACSSKFQHHLLRTGHRACIYVPVCDSVFNSRSYPCHCTFRTPCSPNKPSAPVSLFRATFSRANATEKCQDSATAVLLVPVKMQPPPPTPSNARMRYSKILLFVCQSCLLQIDIHYFFKSYSISIVSNKCLCFDHFALCP